MDNGPSPEFAPLWQILRGHGYLWHRTSLQSLERIIADQVIVPNSGQFETTFGQSKVSYSRHLEAVSLFDFDSSDERAIFEEEWKWGSVLTSRLPACGLIRIDRSLLDPSKLLLPRHISDGDARLDLLPDHIRRMRMVLPAVEAIHMGPVSTATFRGFVLTAVKQDGGYLWQDVATGTGALPKLADLSSQWTIEDHRLTAKRHARGQYTLAEMIESARIETKK